MINVYVDNTVSLISKVNEKIDSIKLKLQREEIVDAQGAILHAKSCWMSQAEHSTKYFYSLEKRKSEAKIMVETYDQNSHLINNPVKVLEIQAKFYEKLYTKDRQIKCIIKDKPERQLSNELKQS